MAGAERNARRGDARILVSRCRLAAALAAGLLAIAPLPLAALVPKTDAPGAQVEAAAPALPLVWLDSVDTALSIAGAEYRPVLVLFSSPDCGWCNRMKAQIRLDKATQDLLRTYVLVEVDVSTTPGEARRYGVRGVPTVALLASDGRMRAFMAGYQPLETLRDALAAGLTPAFVKDNDAAYAALLKNVRGGSLPASHWSDVMRSLARPECREELRTAILTLNPFPSTNLVALLESPELAVRMGAIEILEERTGGDRGFDPWLAVTDRANGDALAQWRMWATGTAAEADAVYAGLTTERVQGYIRDMLGADRHRSVRAMQMLEQGGRPVAGELSDFEAAHPELDRRARDRIREVKYAILMSGRSRLDAAATAHRLVMGTLDGQLKAIAALRESGIGVRAVPIVRDYLEADNGLLREAAAEAILAIAGGPGIAVITPCLEKESDINVIYATLRALGATADPRAVLVLKQYLTHANEDLVIVALNGLAELKYTDLQTELGACLADPRWRVRVAALEAIGKLRIQALGEQVLGMTTDPDEFVRRIATQTLATITEKEDFLHRFAPLFRKYDDLKPMIITQMSRHDILIPPAFITAAARAPRDTVLAILTALGDGGGAGLELALPYVGDEDLDLSCAALGVLARFGTGGSRARGAMCRILREGRREEILSILDAVRIKDDDFAVYAAQFRYWFTDGATETPGAGSTEPDIVDTLLGAFEAAEAPVPATPAVAPVTVDDLLDAFGTVTPPATDAATGTAAAEATLVDFVKALETVMAGDDKAMRFRAALRLAALRNPRALPILAEALAEQTVDVRLSIAEAAGSINHPGGLVFELKLLDDPASEVRVQAVENLLRTHPDKAVEIILGQLTTSDSRLTVLEATRHEWRELLRRSASRAQLNEWLPRLLAASQPECQSFGLLLAGLTPQPEQVALLKPFLTSRNPLHRRAALYALGTTDSAAFLGMLDTVVADPSPRVRAVVPGVYGQGNDGGWVHYFTETESIGHLGYYFQSSSRQRRLAPEAEAALQRLTADKEPTVSVEAFFCLIAHTVPVDLNRMTTVLDAIPDVGVIGERLAQLLEQQHGRLGAEFRVLVPYALRAARQDSYYARELRKKYGEVAEDDQFFSMRVLDRPAVSNAPLMATYRTGDTTDEAITNRPLRLLYFSQYGCKDCAKAERLLSDMTSYFGRLEVTKLDIRAHDAMLLNETLCERFGIDERSRLVAPAMFTAAGGLVRDDITFDRLTGLLARAAREPATDWYALTTEAQQQADTAIMGRGRGMGYGVACLAGLLDGVNPCAFATIIFLLSYLHIARRTPRQILQVGLAFILGVFIAYFSLGLGLGELVKKLGVVGRVATVVNGVLAAFVFIVAVLNVRDGILCLRGRMAEMTLQLPGALKAQIHGVVRRGARHHRFVIAAFLIGLAISVLELACTGQVYLPTIVYMLNRAETRWDGLGLLLAYNAAFILPLFVVFGLAALGLTHARLTTFMERHAALVKFATAALFFILFAVFIRTLV